VTIDSAAHLFLKTVEALSKRAPAIVAAAAHQMQGIILGLHFGDNSHAAVHPQHSRLVAHLGQVDAPSVEAYFDDRAIHLLFDLEKRPVDQLWAGSLDVRGDHSQVQAVWRAFQLLSQRAVGLRVIQGLWQEYRQQHPEIWTASDLLLNLENGNGHRSVLTQPTGWQAIDYFTQRHPEAIAPVRPLVGGTVHADIRILWDGRHSRPWWDFQGAQDADLMEVLQRCKARAREEILRAIPDREPKAQLYDLIQDYPSREGKGLRPTLTFATCCALGGSAEDATRTAGAIELFHNAFLVHDDISDESTHRRGIATLHEAYGVGIAVNTGDAMNLLAMDLILSNLPHLGLARTLSLVHETMHMCRETVEGQAIELDWIREQRVPSQDEDYFFMSTKKTGWYTCISPCRLGAVCAGVTDLAQIDAFNEVFRLVGIAFQIQDDVLNLVGEQALYGKESLGDLLEGKRTVMLIHLLRMADAATCDRVYEIIRLPRSQKRQSDAEEVFAAMQRYGSVDYAIELADRLAHEGVRRFETDLAFIPESEAKAVLRQIANYVTTRPL